MRCIEGLEGMCLLDSLWLGRNRITQINGLSRCGARGQRVVCRLDECGPPPCHVLRPCLRPDGAAILEPTMGWT